MQHADFSIEGYYYSKGYRFVLGVDEVGRGSFAGPVVAAGVIFNPKNVPLFMGITDSKLLRHATRQILDKEIKKRAIAYAVSKVSVRAINKNGIGKATLIAFRKTINKLLNSHNILVSLPAGRQGQSPNIFLLVDGYHIRYIRGIGLKNQRAIIRGDQKCISIAAASILAKVYRDTLMENLHIKYPRYAFNKNKGYGTKEHQEALKMWGLSRIHRSSFNLSKYL